MSKKLLYMCMMAIMMVFSMSAYALDQKDGVYQIGTADDLIAFAELVNGENPYACAVLTADIEKPVDDKSMIGRSGQDFQGTFDGKGHTIKINLFSQGEQGTAIPQRRNQGHYPEPESAGYHYYQSEVGSWYCSME
jgi:hypothetical protein